VRIRPRRFAAPSIAALLAASAFAADAAEITLRDDKFQPYREYTTGRVVVSTYPNLLATELIARVDRKSAATEALVSVEVAYEGYRARHYDSARDAHAEPLAFNEVAHEGGCPRPPCAYNEKFTVAIPMPELRNAPAAGYQLKVFAKGGGDAVITVPRGPIDRLLAVIDKH
jgi:hypothetical protein